MLLMSTSSLMLQYLYLSNRLKKNAQNAIGKLTIKIANALGETAIRNVFKTDGSKFQVCDIVKKEFAEYQTEVIPESFYLVPKKDVAGRQQNSYWDQAYREAGIYLKIEEEESGSCRVDDYWFKVQSILWTKRSTLICGHL